MGMFQNILNFSPHINLAYNQNTVFEGNKGYNACSEPSAAKRYVFGCVIIRLLCDCKLSCSYLNHPSERQMVMFAGNK